MIPKQRRKPYMPDSDVGRQMWMERFITQIETDPQRYGFADARMFEYVQRTIRTYIKAVAAAANRGLRSPKVTREKNEARSKAVPLCREIAMRLKRDPTLSSEEKDLLGIRTEEPSPAVDAALPSGPSAASEMPPDLAVLSSADGGHVIRYRFPAESRRAKPRGVSHLLLFASIGEKPRMSATHARLLGAYTRRPFVIRYPMGCGLEGLYVTYYGRWLTTRGEIGAWSKGVSMMIAAAPVSLHDCAFSHLFAKEGFIEALPRGATPGAARVEAEDRPMLEGEASEGDGLFAALMTARPQMLEASTVRLLSAG